MSPSRRYALKEDNRRQQNRLSAQKSALKKKKFIEALLKEVDDLRSANASLQLKNTQLVSELAKYTQN